MRIKSHVYFVKAYRNEGTKAAVLIIRENLICEKGDMTSG